MSIHEFAHLENNALEDLKNLERKHEIILLAYRKSPEPAPLSKDQIAELQTLEKRLGFTLIAYR